MPHAPHFAPSKAGDCAGSDGITTPDEYDTVKQLPVKLPSSDAQVFPDAKALLDA